ncbi:hypothetical protein [Listeria grayi]|uniref:Uncharacterized protein n=1 Tax=Listeria grayi DSM 20601 TaxID=525367 RepID=D7UUR7_LISGR|nr:hypothetical protein [Listeria grayi]EFI84993.1 hypothetical protein HMPREF0556_10192 [Listeria grayi DSM 20601]MBC1922048.1 hypothetical protein [Listeria grayi]
MNPNMLLITSAGYIVGIASTDDEERKLVTLKDVYINNAAQQLIDHFESLKVAREQIIGYKSLSAADTQKLLARWQANYFTTS